MKVLHVNTHMNIGGIGQYILSLSVAIRRKGINCIVASAGGNMEEELKASGIEHRRIDIKTKFEFAPKVFFAASGLADIIEKEKIDIIHAHTRVSQVASGLAARKTGTPCISTCHGFFKPRLSRKLFDTWGQTVVAISAPVKAHLQMDFKIDPSRIELIHNGVDIERFSKNYSNGQIAEIKRSLGLKDGPVIGTMGRLSSVKGQRFLVEAMKYVAAKESRAQCMIIGSGPEEGALKDFARSLGIEDRIKFTGSIYKDIASYLACMDVFVLPSIKEGLGLALLEAMASGRPCVASDVGGIVDIITDGVNGIIAPVANGVAIADAVLKILDDKSLSSRLAGEGRDFVKEKFPMDAMAGKMAKLYDRVISEKN